MKGVAQTIPNERILISSLTLQEAKDSSAVIGHIEANMQVSRQTASRYLEKIVELGLLQKEKMWKENYYINTKLMNLFIDFGKCDIPDNHDDNDNGIESVHVKELSFL